MLSTKSMFYYLTDNVTRSNYKIDFSDGTGPTIREGTLLLGSYSPKELADEVQRAMNEVSTIDYTVTFNRTNKTFTISADSNFTLLADTGTNRSNDIYQVLGFNSSDKTGSNTYTSDSVAVTEYRPQFWVQSYISTEDYQEKIQPSINESASGVIEVLSFGTKKLSEMSLKFITNYPQGVGNDIENDSSAVEKARAFLQVLTQKRNVEFMPNRDDASVYEIFLCEKLSDNSTGTGYKLKEMISRKLGNYYESGKITFRKMD